MEVKTYRSPTKKLLRFFERSRNGWKQKCQRAKVRIKRLCGRVQKLKVSRNRWKVQTQSLSSELEQIREELAQLKSGGG
jgi:chromosome segregation ATPase